jgi:hypothetical protein
LKHNEGKNGTAKRKAQFKKKTKMKENFDHNMNEYFYET